MTVIGYINAMKKVKLLAVVVIFLITTPFSNIHLHAGSGILNNSHDITTLPHWGPYSKRYAGISHINNLDSGVRFDFSVMPGYYRNKQSVPHVLFESNYSPWNITPDLKRITYRHQLEWQDKVYVDVTFININDDDVLVECHCVNNTELPQNLVLNNMAYIDLADDYPNVVAHGADGIKWIDGVKYLFAEPAKPSAQYRLVYDGWYRYEHRTSNSIDGSLLSRGFGRNAGDRVGYHIGTSNDKERALAIRYKVAKNNEARFSIKDISDSILTFPGTGNFEILYFTLPNNYKNDVLELISIGTSDIEIDGFFIGTAQQVADITFKQIAPNLTPKISSKDQSVTLKYDMIEKHYGIAWDFPNSQLRQIISSELESFLRRKVHDHVANRLVGDGKGHYTNAFLRPIIVEPFSEKTIYMLLTSGTPDKVEQTIAQFHQSPQDFVDRANIITRNTEQVLPEGLEFMLGYQMLQASLLSNIVYPVYTQGQYIRHFTPGKNWNSLYTWDSGFISWALADIDPIKAFESLRAYTTQEGAQSSFIHHGTPLPIQFFAFHDIYNRGISNEELKFIYPRLRQFYHFMAGHEPTSTTRMKGSNLLRSWDYFYNSGGWDDYPPQRAIMGRGDMLRTTTPVVTTAYYLRAARIMRMVAIKLGMKGDIKLYNDDIAAFTDGLQKYSWDEESGYFGYVTHDADQNPKDIFRYKNSVNYNMGLDGTSPIVSGILTSNQQEKIIEHLFSEDEMWTKVGISTVDQSAPYYRIDGYWNGTVWMPHQFITFKAFLDNGQPDLAYRIARRALEVWQRECSTTYHTFEHFIIASQRGAGWHQFSGLSSPVINWFASYFNIGTVTTGFEIALSENKFENDFSSYKATLEFDTSVQQHSRSLLLVMNPKYNYQVFFNGRPIEFTSRYSGQIEITLPATNKRGLLEIKKAA